MLLSALLAASLASLPASPPPAALPEGGAERVWTERVRPEASPEATLVAAGLLAPVDSVLGAPVRLAPEEGPSPLPYEEGGGLSSDTRQVLALVLGLLVGFGLGHLVAQDRQGFILFLVVDLAIIAVSTIVRFTVGFGLTYLALLVSHIIQGLDAYAKAGGERLIEVAREKAVRLAGVPGREEPLMTTRAFSFAF